MSVQLLLNIDDRSQVGEARRAAAELGRKLSLDATSAGNVALAVTEVATNIVKHAGRGSLLLRPLEQRGRGGDVIGGIEVLALDRGPGIANVAASLRDGHSTAGSMGMGLGALGRISAAMQLYSQIDKGTAVWLQFWASVPSRPVGGETDQASPPGMGSPDVGAVWIPKSGESVCGDSWYLASSRGRTTVLVADGLGHGADAARAARAAVELLATHIETEPGELLELGHAALASTRGAAVAVARFEPAAGRGTFAGVGNIAARVEGTDSRRQLVSHNGTLGHSVRRIQEFAFVFPAGGLLILHSDGLTAHWALADYPGLMAKHPALIAGVLYRDHDRGRDDVTVVVIKNGAGR